MSSTTAVESHRHRNERVQEAATKGLSELDILIAMSRPTDLQVRCMIAADVKRDRERARAFFRLVKRG